jgi:threonine dehydrogenase-like Zn-dependent dehydrogenase
VRALVWHGKEDIRYDTVTDPAIEDSRDAIIRVTSCAICGSDLHLFHNFIPAMLPGDIMGHEMMGEVVDVGHGAQSKLKVGDRIVVPFTIICGECDQCRRGNFSVCERTNRNKQLADKAFGHATAGLFGYTHLTGGYPGGQAEYLPSPTRRISRCRAGFRTSRYCSSATSYRRAGKLRCNAISSRLIRSRSGAVVLSVRCPSAVRSCSVRSR